MQQIQYLYVKTTMIMTKYSECSHNEYQFVTKTLAVIVLDTVTRHFQDENYSDETSIKIII